MRILFLSDQFPPRLDGIGDYTYQLSKAFVKAGHQVSVYCRKAEGDIQGYTKEQVGVYAQQKGWGLGSVLNVISIVRAKQPDYISFQYNPYGFSHLGMPFHMLLLVCCLRLMGFKVQTTFHEIAVRLDAPNPKIWITGIAQRVIANAIHLWSNHSFTSIEMYREYIYVAKQKLSIVPIGCTIDDGVIPNWELTESPMLSYFGRNPRGVLAIPELLAELKKNGINIPFILVGKFSDAIQQKLKTAAGQYGVEEQITITGFLPASKAMETLRASTIFVALMEDEGMTLKSSSLAAAFCAGLPVVGTAGDMTDTYFFKNNENCLFVENDPAQMAKAIKSLLHNPDKMKQLAIGAQYSFDQHLSWKATYEAYSAVMNGRQAINSVARASGKSF